MAPIIHRSLTVISALVLMAAPAAFAADSNVSAEEALQRLKDGNRRFVEGERNYPNLDAGRIAETGGGQNPYVTILSCSDSRVPPEHVFDAGIGDIFSIRVAGNVSDTDEIGTMEYGIAHLKTPLLVVLGHTQCGAVTAVAEGAEVHGSIPELVDNIVPAVESVRGDNPGLEDEAFVLEAIKANVWQSIEDLLAESAGARELLLSGELRIEGALYHLESGKVEWMGPHPKAMEIAADFEKDAPGFVHSVYFYIAEDADGEDVQQLMDDCKNLLGSIETVRKIIVGPPAGTPRDVVDNSYGVNLIVYFDGKEGHEYYQTAEAHLKFIERNKHTWSRVQVYDMIPK